MKGKLGSRIWKWAAINGVGLLVVLLLAYGAGADSGGLSILDFGALPQGAGFQLLGALFVVIATTVAFLIQLSSRVLKPVEQLAQFSEKITEGDYSARVETGSGDDFGLIAENCNRIASVAERADTSEAHQQALDRSLLELSEMLSEVSRGELFTRAHVMADPSAGLAEALNRTLESLARMVDRVHDCGAEVTASARQGLSAAESVAGSAVRQQQEIANLSAALEKFTAAMREIGIGGENTLLASRRALQAAEESESTLHEAAEGAERIRSAMAETAGRLKALGERSLQVYEVINIINDTHLLALNAAIEASRAAQAGNGLEVLDAELRKMGEHSRKSTKNVVALLQTIHSDASEAVAAVEQACRLAEDGSHGMRQAVGVFAQVAPSLQEATLNADALTGGCRDRLQDAQTMSSSVQNAVRMSRQAAEMAQKTVGSTEQLVRATLQLHETLSRLRTTPRAKADALPGELATTASAGRNLVLP